MPRGLLVHELFLAIATLPDNQEVTARFIDAEGDEQNLAIFEVDASFGQAALVLDDLADTPDTIGAIRDLVQKFETDHLEGDVPLPPLPIFNAIRDLVREIYEQLPEE